MYLDAFLNPLTWSPWDGSLGHCASYWLPPLDSSGRELHMFRNSCTDPLGTCRSASKSVYELGPAWYTMYSYTYEENFEEASTSRSPLLPGLPFQRPMASRFGVEPSASATALIICPWQHGNTSLSAYYTGLLNYHNMYILYIYIHMWLFL